MQISTGYFAKSRAYSDAGYALVSIAKVAPWFLPNDLEDKMFYLPDLAPTDEILALKDKPGEYEMMYHRLILARMHPIAVYQRLRAVCSVAKTDKVVLLCYETPEKFCHRHIVANWLNSAPLGCEVKEVDLQPPKEPSLFDDSDGF